MANIEKLKQLIEASSSVDLQIRLFFSAVKEKITDMHDRQSFAIWFLKKFESSLSSDVTPEQHLSLAEWVMDAYPQRFEGYRVAARIEKKLGHFDNAVKLINLGIQNIENKNDEKFLLDELSDVKNRERTLLNSKERGVHDTKTKYRSGANVGIKVSVIVPVYNAEEYLRKCLDSIVNQTIKDIEVLIINDGSPDNSLNIAREFEYKFSNCHVVNQFNSGVANARNKGMRLANGEFVAFMDSDDYYPDNNCLELLYEKAKQKNVLICGGSFSEDHDDGRWIRKDFKGIYTKYTFEKDGYLEYKDYQFDYGYHRFIYDRKMLLSNKIFYPEYIRFQDPPFFVRAMATAKRFYVISKPTYCYRYGHQSLEWNELRTSHVLFGLLDNLKISKQENLENLNRLTTWRLLSEYKGPILKNIQSPIISELLNTAKEYMDTQYIESSDELSENMREIYKHNF